MDMHIFTKVIEQDAYQNANVSKYKQIHRLRYMYEQKSVLCGNRLYHLGTDYRYVVKVNISVK